MRRISTLVGLLALSAIIALPGCQLESEDNGDVSVGGALGARNASGWAGGGGLWGGGGGLWGEGMNPPLA